MSASKTNGRRAKDDAKPKQDTNTIHQLGLKAHALAIQHKARIGKRLSQSFLSSFEKDIADLVSVVPAVINAKDGKVQLTAAQSAALLAGHKLLKGLRTTVKGFNPEEDVHLAYGIGIDENKVTPAVDTTLASKAHALAVRYHAELEPRLPAGAVAGLAADLTTLGAPPASTTPPSQPPPSLVEAMANAVALISAVHEAVRSAGVKAAVRKEYGVSSKEIGPEAKDVVARGDKIIHRAHENPIEALSVGILPADVTALVQALADLKAAETLAKGNAGLAEISSKEKRSAEKRMREAVARIRGAGVLAFATHAAVRVEFAALTASKSE